MIGINQRKNCHYTYKIDYYFDILPDEKCSEIDDGSREFSAVTKETMS